MRMHTIALIGFEDKRLSLSIALIDTSLSKIRFVHLSCLSLTGRDLPSTHGIDDNNVRSTCAIGVFHGPHRNAD